MILHYILNFLAFFFDKKLQTSSGPQYKSALSVPLRLQNVDLSDSLVTSLLRAMFLQQPKTPIATPVLYLNKVITYIEDPPPVLVIETSLRQCTSPLLLVTW